MAGWVIIAGKAFTVTVVVLVHPLISLYVITLVPADTPVTKPELLTVAIPVEDETHGLVEAGVPDPVIWVEEPAHMTSVPEMDGLALVETFTKLLPDDTQLMVALVPIA